MPEPTRRRIRRNPIPHRRSTNSQRHPASHSPHDHRTPVQGRHVPCYGDFALGGGGDVDGTIAALNVQSQTTVKVGELQSVTAVADRRTYGR